MKGSASPKSGGLNSPNKPLNKAQMNLNNTLQRTDSIQMVGDGILDDVFEDDLFKMKGGSSHGSLGNKGSDENIFRGVESPTATALRIGNIESLQLNNSALKNKFSLTQLAKTRMNLTNAKSKAAFDPTAKVTVNVTDLKNLKANLDELLA